MKKLEPVSVRLTPDMKEDLKRFAAEDKRSMSNLIELILESYIQERRREEADGKKRGNADKSKDKT